MLVQFLTIQLTIYVQASHPLTIKDIKISAARNLYSLWANLQDFGDDFEIFRASNVKLASYLATFAPLHSNTFTPSIAFGLRLLFLNTSLTVMLF